MTLWVIRFPFVCIISTHTLTWSVTRITLSRTAQIYISTHTLTWSVTQMLKGQWVCNGISTHTLTWSVTGYSCDEIGI